MKTRFNTYDIVCGVFELQKLVGLRVNQIYDIDNKTYLIRLQGGDGKTTLLIESGTRFHTTAFEWPKNVVPSGFSMKLRKHLKNKRLEKLEQLGVDRIVNFQFGTGDVAHHVFVELYDRGNIILTDNELTILYILRPHNEGEEVRLAVREKYPISRAKIRNGLPTVDCLQRLVSSAKTGNRLRTVLIPILDYGPALIDHILTKHDLQKFVIRNAESTPVNESGVSDQNKAGKHKKKEICSSNTYYFDIEKDMSVLNNALQEAEDIFIKAHKNIAKGYIIQRQEEKPSVSVELKEYFYQNIEYHPYHFSQFEGAPCATFETFMLAVDEFYSALEGQKIDFKTIQQERDALKKLSNVKKDHVKRLEELNRIQENDKVKAELITCNQTLVDNAILAVRTAIANQMSWPDIHELVKAAANNGDPVASTIKQLKLEMNHISLELSDPYEYECHGKDEVVKLVVDVDLALSAWANARKYYDQKKNAAQKEQKTIDASKKALKSAERKTQQTLKDVRKISTISKARKVYWFEKFYWFISSENFLVIGGRDAQQNEIIVKRYMRSSDIYVHAEIQGASSVVIRNPSGCDIPPKTLVEAGTMAISYSVAWDAKVVTNAYWVRSEQVSKTAPSGEFLGTGSFMIRGKKNFLPSCHLVMGISLLFRLEDSFVDKHRGERKIRTFEEEENYGTDNKTEEVTFENASDDEEITLSDIADDVEIRKDAKGGALKLEELPQKENHDDWDFPDTQVKVTHESGNFKSEGDFDLKTLSIDPESVESDCVYSMEDTTIIAAMLPRKKQQKSKKRKDEKEKTATCDLKLRQYSLAPSPAKNSLQIKRGQKGKLKKIKSKYKDQDEEERKLRMQILKSSGKDKGNLLEHKETQSGIILSKDGETHAKHMKQQQFDVDEVDDLLGGADVEMIDFLTGQPLEDDELLFAIPVVAPYQTLQSYKYKIKLTPGTGKRGRAAKTVIAMFSKDKNCTARERDLLRSIKEETLARNIPGKVKLSAPQLQKLKNQR